MYELLQPSLTKQAEERDMLDKLTVRVKNKLETRLTQVEYVLKLNVEGNGEPDVFTDIFERFTKSDIAVKEEVQLLKNDIETIDKSTKDFKFLVDTSQNVIDKTN